MTAGYTLPSLPARPGDAHKGTFGTLLIVGGSTQMIGAPMLAARSAYRAGCGLVRVAMPASVLAQALSILPEAIGLALAGDAGDGDRLAEAIQQVNAIAIGPGLGLDAQGDALLDVILASDRPIVLDADALNLLARRDSFAPRSAQTVMTPHPGEMRRLLRHVAGRDEVPPDDDGRQQLAIEAAKAFGAVLLLKGQRTIVTDGDRVYVNQTGDSSLAKAGTGDVLTGLIGSLLAQGMNTFDAAVCGALYHGLAGEYVGSRRSPRAVLATEIADALGHVMPTLE